MSNARIRLILSSPSGKIPLSSFSRAIGKLRLILEEIEERISNGEGHNIWAVTNLNMASPADIQIEPLEAKEFLDAEQSIKYAIDGFSSLNRTPVRPAGFSDTALKRTREFAGLKDAKSLDEIKLLNGSNEVSLTGHIIANVDDLIGPPPKDAIGSIRGKLDIINVHTGLQVGIFQDLDRKCIKAIIEDENDELLERAKSLLGKLIVATGEIKRNKFGIPREIRVQTIEPASERTDIREAFGIDPDFTDGLSVDEFLRRQRDE